MDLEQRTYQRLIPPKFLTPYEDFVGGGLPFHRQVISGSMDEIESIKILARETSDYRQYAVRLIWTEEAQEQAREIASLLDLPVLESSLY